LAPSKIRAYLTIAGSQWIANSSLRPTALWVRLFSQRLRVGSPKSTPFFGTDRPSRITGHKQFMDTHPSQLYSHFQQFATHSRLHAHNFTFNFNPFNAFTSTTNGLNVAPATTDVGTSLPQSPIPSTSSSGHPGHPAAFLRPRVPFKLATFNVRTLARIGQQAALARTLETLAIDICCLQETRIQDSSSVIQLTSIPTRT
jgi:hypothetical protein